MDAFLSRYYADVRNWLGDPTHSKRVTDAQLLEDFYEAEVPIWEALMMAGGQESSVGRCEVQLTLEDAQEFYALPGSFRQFLSMKRWGTKTEDLVTLAAASYADDTKLVTLTGGLTDYCWRTGDELVITAPAANAGTYTIASPTTKDNTFTLSTSAGDDASETIAATIQRTVPDKAVLYGRLGSIAENEPGPGVLIMNAQRGCMIRPIPSLEDDMIFTLVFQKGPVILHYGEAAAVSAGTLTLDSTPTGGELVAQPGYYLGSMIRVFSATLGAPQVREIVAHDTTWDRVQVRRDWDPLPTGTILYEICPALPSNYDKIYSLDVAMKAAATRRNPTLVHMLKSLRKQLWNGCMNYVLSGVADRAPSRTPVRDYSRDDPYDGYDS